MKERISKKGKRVLAFVLVFAMVLGVAPFSIGNEVKAASEPTLKETVVFSDTFDNGTSWNTSAGNWRLGSTSHADLVGVRNGTAPLGYATSTRNLYNVELNDVHVGADVRVTKAECYGSNLQYHFIFARGNTLGTSSVAFGLKTKKNATKSSLVVGYYNGNDSINVWHETEAVYDINITYTLDLYVVGSLVMAKCNDQTVYLEEQTGLSVKGYCGITDRRATSNSAGGTYGTDYTKAGYFDNFTVGTVEEIIADGFKVNGPVVITKDGTGVADITMVTNGVDVATIDDAVVKVDALKNKATNLYEGEYTVSTTIKGTEKTSIATRVFVVDDLSKTVTKMNDSRWTGASATATPKFTVDANGKATLTPSGSASAGISTLNVGATNGAYGDFYVEYTLRMTDLAAEARGFVDSFLCMDSYGNPNSNAWGANLFFDNRASQAPNNTFWARLRMSDGSVNKTYSQTFADPDIEGGKPMKIGMLVQGNTITLFINGVEAATHTGSAAYKGWFGISQSGTAGNSTVENFIYVPLEEKVVRDIQLSYPKMVLPGANVEVSAIPIYNWPYGQGDVITEGVTVTGLDTSTLGEKTFKASYGGVEKTLTLLVSNTMFVESFDGILSDLTDHGWGKVNNNSAALKDEQLHLSGSQEGLYVTALSGSEAWTDYTLKADVRIEKTNQTPNTALATISARTTGLDNGYEWSIAIDKSGATYARLYDRAAAKFLGRVDYPVEIGETYNLKLTVVGNTIKGYINGEKILETTANTSATGTVGVRRLGYNVYYDNVIVTLPEEDVPVQDVTQQQIWFTDTFESESVMTERGWDKDGTIQNGELILNNKYPTAFLKQIEGSNTWTDYTAQAHITVVDSDEISPVGNSVSALIVRSISDATGYEFGVSIQVSNDKGGFRLYNRTTSELLASTTEVVAERGKTYQLTAVVEGNRIRCYVDGQMVFDVTDTKNSNPTGYVGLRTVGYSGAYDNIVVRKVTDADRKGIFSNSTATSPVTGDYAMPMYIPVIAMVTALTVVVFITRRRFHANK